MSQEKYVIDLLKETGMLASKTMATSVEKNHKLGEAQSDEKVNKEMYQHLVGRLIYLAHTWLDMTYSVSVISQFMHDPRVVHLQVVY